MKEADTIDATLFREQEEQLQSMFSAFEDELQPNPERIEKTMSNLRFGEVVEESTEFMGEGVNAGLSELANKLGKLWRKK